MMNDYKKLRKSVTLGTTFVFVVATLPFIAFLIHFYFDGCETDYIASIILCSVVTLILIAKYASYYLIFWCAIHQDNASIKECVMQCTEECLDELSKDMSKEFHMEFPKDLPKDSKLPLISACACAVKRMYFISTLIFTINSAQFCYIGFPEAKRYSILLIACFLIFIFVFAANIHRDLTLKHLPGLVNINNSEGQKF